MTEAERKRKKEKTVMVSIRLQKSTDAEILEYLDGEAKQTIIKAALREYMSNHPKENEQRKET